MNNAGNISTIKARLSANPEPAVYVLFALQPLLNILSYWTARPGGGHTLTLLLRFGVLAVVVLAGFLLSGRKRLWIFGGAACGLFWLCHMAVCASVGSRCRCLPAVLWCSSGGSPRCSGPWNGR